MKTLYLDIFSGLAGDMFIAALLDLGVDLHELEHGSSKKLKVDGYHLRHVSRGSRRVRFQALNSMSILRRRSIPEHEA